MEFCKVNHTHTHKSRKNPQQNYPLSGITNIQHRNIGKNVNNSQNKRSKKIHTHTHTQAEYTKPNESTSVS